VDETLVGHVQERVQAAVLLSGTGRSLENLLKFREQGDLLVDIPVVISSRANVRGVDVARSAGIETHVITRRDAADPVSLSRAVLDVLGPHNIGLLVLAGYLRQLEILPEWRDRIMNIHPSLLPLFGGRGMYGEHVHQAVLDAGMKVSGCTVHIVNAEYDAGPIVAQRCVPVLEGDTPQSLGARVFEAECLAYPKAINLFASGRIQVQGNRVRITDV
jgi:phosphoribosylglycinamide formyltransferase 1